LERVIGCHPTRFLPNPIALPRFTPGDHYHPTAEDPIRLLMAAQIKPRKRPLDAIEIVRILVKKNLPVHLTICGNGTQMSQMLAAIDRDHLHPYIDVKGRVDRAEVLDCLQKVETVLLCSDHEGLPRILQEAIAASKGIVAYNNPGSCEALTAGPDQWPLGRLVSVGDCHGATVAIMELARYFRSTATPVSLPPFPNTRAIVHEYEAVFQGLILSQISPHPSLQAVS
jgi:glycosyltransferase involved in cell wall biosynthesis